MRDHVAGVVLELVEDAQQEEGEQHRRHPCDRAPAEAGGPLMGQSLGQQVVAQEEGADHDQVGAQRKALVEVQLEARGEGKGWSVGGHAFSLATGR
ncbi:hypothetical protein D3C86_1324760 [compost metagenome]